MSEAELIVPSERDVILLYSEMMHRAPRWLEVMSGYPQTSFSIFEDFVRGWSPWVRTKDVVVFQERHKHRVIAHPVIMQRGVVEQIKAIVGVILGQEGVLRLELHMAENAGHTVRKLAVESGFKKEGTLRHYLYQRGDAKRQERLLDVDLYAILRKEVTNGV